MNDCGSSGPSRPRWNISAAHIEAIRRANTGRVVSAETRARMSAAAKNRPPVSKRTRIRMSLNSPARKPVKFGGVEFHSQAEAARHFGVAETTMGKWIREGLTEIPKRRIGRRVKRKRGRRS